MIWGINRALLLNKEHDMWWTIIGITIGCLGILITVVVSRNRSNKFSQTQKNTKDSKQEIRAKIDN